MYRVIDGKIVIRINPDGSETFIQAPAEGQAPHPRWRDYEAWLSEGNAPESAPVGPQVDPVRELEMEIVDLRVRADAATAEGFTGLAGALQAEMTARRAGLEKL